MAKRKRYQWQRGAGETSEDAGVGERPSRSEKKRQAARLTQLGAELTALAPKALAKLEMDEALRDAIEECRALKHSGARERQVRRIGKLLRAQDTDALIEALNSLP